MRRQVTPRSKYGARKTEADGIVFHSAAEARDYQTLKLMVKAGIIRDLTLQPEIELIPAFRDRDGKAHRKTVYRADFEYWDIAMGERVIFDTKGKRTAVFSLKEKLVRHKYPGLKFIVAPA